MTTQTPARLPGDPIPPPPEPRYPWRVGVMMAGLVALVLLVLWLAFQVVKGPATPGQYPAVPTITAIARAFEATVAAAETAEPRRPAQVVAVQPAATAAPVRAVATTPPTVATPAPATAVPNTATGSAVTPTSVPAPAPSRELPATTTAAAASELSEPVAAGTPIPSAQAPLDGSPSAALDPQLEAAVSDAYSRYWQVKADAFLTLDSSPLSSVATGPELARLQQRINDDEAAGRATRVSTQHDFAVISASANRAQIDDTYRDLSVWVDPTTHSTLPGQSELVSADNAPEHRILVDMVLVDAGWRVFDGVEFVAQGAGQ